MLVQKNKVVLNTLTSVVLFGAALRRTICTLLNDKINKIKENVSKTI